MIVSLVISPCKPSSQERALMYAWQMHFVTLLFVGLSGKEAEKRSKLCSTVVLVLLLPWMLLGLLLLLLCFNVHLLIVTLSLVSTFFPSSPAIHMRCPLLLPPTLRHFLLSTKIKSTNMTHSLSSSSYHPLYCVRLH